MKDKLLGTKITGLAILLALAAAGWLFVIGPAMRLPETVAARAVAETQAEAALREQIQTVARESKRLPKVEQRMRKLSKRFPAVVDPAGLEAAVTRAAARAGIPPSAVLGIKPGPAEPYTSPGAGASASPSPSASPSASGSAAPVAQQVLQQDVEIEARGSLAQLGAFAQNLERGRRSFLVTDMAVTADEIGYRAKYTTQAYLLPPMQAAPQGNR